MAACKLRVVLLHWAFPPTTGGVESHLFDLAAGLSDLGHSVLVLTGESRPQVCAGAEVISLPVLNLNEIKKREPRDLARDTYVAISTILKDRQVDIVHGHNLHHFSGAAALAVDTLRRERGIRVHHTFHETWPDILSDQPVYKSWSTNFAVSEFVQSQCERLLGIRPTLLRLGVDTARFRCSRDPFQNRTCVTLLHPARLLPWKGVHISLQAMGLLNERNHPVRLILTANQQIIDWNSELSEYEIQVRAIVHELKLDSLVEFRVVTYSDMPNLYNECDVVLYPTIGEEPYGLVPLEAMSCGRPVVVSDSGGIPETVVNGVTGIIVSRENAVELAGAVQYLLENPALAQSFGRQGRVHVRSKFSQEAYLNQLIKYYGQTEVPS